MSTDNTSERPGRRRRHRWRLRALLGFTALVLAFFVFSRLTPEQARRLGPWGQPLYELVNPPAEYEVSRAGRRLIADVKTLGGEARRMEQAPGFLRLVGGTDSFHIRANGTQFGDEDLARLVQNYGKLIWGLDIRNTNVTDEGLRHLTGLPSLEQLVLGNDDLSGFRGMLPNEPPTSPITDAGLVHLRDLPQLMSLNFSGLPITDAGLASIGDLPKLGALYLSRTKVQGQNLAKLKSLPKLAILYLDNSEVTEKALSQLAGGSNLQFLSLNRLSLTAEALKTLKALPQLRQLEIIGCGLLDEEVDDLRTSKPGLKIQRH
jgi:hypothetical protein